MNPNKKYNIINEINDDAPFGNINWCTVSFLSPDKLESTKLLDVKGFKVHNGYNTLELAHGDVKKIKERKKDHDVYLSEIGKIYAWDDATKADEIEYDNQKLNELEKTRRENIDKIKLMGQQFKNEYKTLYANVNSERRDKVMKRMQQKLYDKGLITKREYDLIQEENKPVKEIKDEAAFREKMNTDIEEYFKTDYLDENDPVPLKYGCISLFSPKQIQGLSTLCFKIRGLFQTSEEAVKRTKKLGELYPNDRIYKFEIGKWCAFSEKDNADEMQMLKQLNYFMKCYLDNLVHEKEEFEKRKERLEAKTEQEKKIVQTKNRLERRKEKREAKKAARKARENGDTPTPTPAPPTTTAPAPQPAPDNSTIQSINTNDTAAIADILKFIEDPELKNKFPSNPETTQTMIL